MGLFSRKVETKILDLQRANELKDIMISLKQRISLIKKGSRIDVMEKNSNNTVLINFKEYSTDPEFNKRVRNAILKALKDELVLVEDSFNSLVVEE